MTTHRATIKENDQVLLQDIRFLLHESIDPRSGLSTRGGSFDLPPGKYIQPGMYRIILDDGRQGDILINNTTINNGSQRATFIGSGEWS